MLLLVLKELELLVVIMRYRRIRLHILVYIFKVLRNHLTPRHWLLFMVLKTMLIIILMVLFFVSRYSSRVLKSFRSELLVTCRSWLLWCLRLFLQPKRGDAVFLVLNGRRFWVENYLLRLFLLVLLLLLLMMNWLIPFFLQVIKRLRWGFMLPLLLLLLLLLGPALSLVILSKEYRVSPFPLLVEVPFSILIFCQFRWLFFLK